MQRKGIGARTLVLGDGLHLPFIPAPGLQLRLNNITRAQATEQCHPSRSASSEQQPLGVRAPALHRCSAAASRRPPPPRLLPDQIRRRGSTPRCCRTLPLVEQHRVGGGGGGGGTCVYKLRSTATSGLRSPQRPHLHRPHRWLVSSTNSRCRWCIIHLPALDHPPAGADSGCERKTCK